MSRIGKLAINIPTKVKVNIDSQFIHISGPYGELSRQISELIEVQIRDEKIYLKNSNDTKVSNQLYGLTRTLISNMVIGVSERFKCTLQLQGVGYRAQITNQDLILNLGFSHPMYIAIPQGIEIQLEKSTTINIIGFDKELVGQLAATIRKKRPPEPYKRKGILYQGEIIKRKVGKSGK